MRSGGAQNLADAVAGVGLPLALEQSRHPSPFAAMAPMTRGEDAAVGGSRRPFDCNNGGFGGGCIRSWPAAVPSKLPSCDVLCLPMGASSLASVTSETEAEREKMCGEESWGRDKVEEERWAGPTGTHGMHRRGFTGEKISRLFSRVFLIRRQMHREPTSPISQVGQEIVTKGAPPIAR